MKMASGIALLLAALPLAASAGTLELERCAREGFGEPSCGYTARHAAGSAGDARNRTGSLRTLRECTATGAATPGTRAYRRCMRPVYAHVGGSRWPADSVQ